MHIDFAISTDCGKVRNHNEDRASVVINNLGYVIGIVCDGMGGHSGGKQASKLVVDYFKEEMLNMPQYCIDAEKIIPYINEALTKVLLKINKFAEKHPEFQDMGTTLVASISTPTKTFITNVGDSRAYFLNKIFIKKITEDHNVKNYLKEKQNEDPSADFQNLTKIKNKNALTSAIGPTKEFKIDIYKIDNKEGCLILCTDGFYNFFEETFAVSLMLRPLTTIEKVNTLMRSVIDRSNDNITLVMINMTEGD